MEPPANDSSDSHVAQSSAAVQQAYSSGAITRPTISHGQFTAQSTPRQPSPTSQPLGLVPKEPAEESAVEQEWIQKAKEVVAQTQDDPFMQNKMLSQLKAQYLATRYGKAVGIDPNK